MSNVFELFQKKKIEKPSDPKTIVTTAVANILSSNAQLARAIKQLSKHLDAFDHAIDALGDTDTQTRFKQATKLIRKRLTMAILDISQAVRKLPALQQELTEAVARRTSRTTNQDQPETATDGHRKT